MHAPRLLAALFLLFLAVSAHAIPRNPDHPPLGGSNTVGIPEGQLWLQPWGLAGTWWPNQFFWQHFTPPGTTQQESIQSADGAEAAGLYAVIGAVAWIDTYQEGLPKGPSGEGGLALDMPAWVAFSTWHKQRDDLMGRTPDGGFNWYDLGWISPATPLDAADWTAAAIPHATYGDFVAEQIGRMAERNHYSGFYAADLVVNMPNLYISGSDFHPRNVEAFELRLGYVIPGITAPEKARFIRAHLMPEWADYWCDAYGHQFAEMARKIQLYRGRSALIGGQIYGNVTLTRWLGGDMRRYLKIMPAENWVFDLEMQGDPLRAVRTAGFYAATVGTAFAWEPSMLLGSKMDVFDDTLRASLTATGLPESAGNAVQHTHWFNIVFAHIATREGGVRRGVASLIYGYGAVALDNVDLRIRQAMNEYIPRKPFGPGFYYSEAMVRSFEREGTCWRIDLDATGAFDKVGCGYFATDAALESLNAANKPDCWIVVHQERLPAAERALLEAHAPVVTPEQAAARTPCHTSSNGNAWGFIDQEGRLVLVVANLARGESIVQLDLSQLRDGTYAPIDALTGATVATVAVTEGRAHFALTLADYDTRVIVFPAAAVATN